MVSPIHSERYLSATRENGVEGKGKDKKRRPSCKGVDRGCVPRTERLLTYPTVQYSGNEGKSMNGNNSTTAQAERFSNTKQLETQWETIDWKSVEECVNRLQFRIAKATREKKWNLVKRLQYLLTHSYYAKLLAVRKVTTNKGKRTPGIDGEVWEESATKMRAVLKLSDKHYKAKPLKRVYIEKKSKKAKRPLGIPCMYDRAMQALYTLALEPVAETTADNNSFGFRKYRSCKDACENLFNILAKKHSAQWILEGDIKGCFDHISHEWLMENIPMDKSMLRQFLKSGYLYQEQMYSTEEGTPQGGIISPILANMVLDGIQEILDKKYHIGNQTGRYSSYKSAQMKVNYTRYADDFIVTAATKEIALEVKEMIKEFMAIRGLELSEEKTLVTHIDDGFNFLGWTFRKFHNKLIIRPSKDSVKKFVAETSETIRKEGNIFTQDMLIAHLNQKIRGWTNYHQTVCSKRIFAAIDHQIFEILWHCMKRKHPNKGRKWIKDKYWKTIGRQRWRFAGDSQILIQLAQTPIIRHPKLKLNRNPYLDKEYFIERQYNLGVKFIRGKYKEIWKKQKGLCYVCGQPIELEDDKRIIYAASSKEGDKKASECMRYVHRYCKYLIPKAAL